MDIKFYSHTMNKRILREGTVDYVGFSYYMTNAVKANGAVDEIQSDGTIEDDYRIAYLKAHIEELKKAVLLDGVELMGYTPWGCIDCVSFTTGEMKNVMALFM